MFNWSFDNVAFLFYLVPVLFIYWALAYWHRAQVACLALSGMLFYIVLQWQYWIILFGSGLFAFWAVKRMAGIRDEHWRYRLAVVGVVLHIIPLLIYKYSATILNTLGAWWHINGSDTHSLWPTWALPLGISFFTFQLMAYWIDVYQENIEPETDVIAFMAYLFFFPKLLSGPITRVQQLMPQIHAKQGFDMALASEGLTQWAWGLFKKRVISDTAVLYIHQVFQPNSAAAGGDYWLVCFLFPIQLYADFSGYSDMAIGIAKLFGFRLNINFNYPFFARNISDYWQRWHMSLTGWMMDYVYTPCAFAWRRRGKWGIVLSIMLTFLLVGIWHGPKWVYLLFGLVYSLYFIPRILFPPKEGDKVMPVWLARIGIYSLVSVTSVIIQSETVEQVILVYSKMLHSFEQKIPCDSLLNGQFLLPLLALWGIDWWGMKHKAEFPLQASSISSTWLRRVMVLCIVLLLFYVQNEQQAFLYFQF